MDRRRMLLAGTGLAAGGIVAEAAEPLADIPIIDTHVHIFDARRPQGVPYGGSPEWEKKSGGVALPATYRGYAAPLHIVGAIVLEASPWVEDNLWVLEQIAGASLFLGMIGDLEPEKDGFAALLERHAKNPLFRGIRCGNIWDRNITAQSTDPRFLDGLKRLAAAGLTMDSANPTVALLQAIIRISDAVPSLRIVLDHLPSLDPAPAEQAAYAQALKEIGTRPQIYAKLSEIDHRGHLGGVAAHRDRLDMLMERFGEDRVIFGTDWPNSWGVATPAEIVAVARAYFAPRGRAACEKFFWRYSQTAYRWKKRLPQQPG